MAVRKHVCNVGDLEEEEVRRFDDGERTYAIYRCPEGNFYATDGYCTHEKEHLADGLVDDFEIVCPRHFGSFDYRTGIATVAPACVALKTYPVETEDEKVFILI